MHDYAAGITRQLKLSPNAGLLYPAEGATPLSDLPASERPSQLVVLDGTWHQTKTLLRDIPVLRSLPRYRLAPTSPSHYRIRREPNADALSTLEAVVAALQSLEPQTGGFDELLAVFDHMIDRQIERSQVSRNWRRHESRGRTFQNIPLAMTRAWDDLVICYGESIAVQHGNHVSRVPIVWTAQRLGDQAAFHRFVMPPSELSDHVLGHLELSREDFHAAVSLTQLERDWSDFLRPSDQLVTYNRGTARLMEQFQKPPRGILLLKSVDFHPGRRYQGLDELVAAENLMVPPPAQPGRAGKRLAQIAALCAHLRELRQVASA